MVDPKYQCSGEDKQPEKHSVSDCIGTLNKCVLCYTHFLHIIIVT